MSRKGNGEPSEWRVLSTPAAERLVLADGLPHLTPTPARMAARAAAVPGACADKAPDLQKPAH